jgi:hypothetical protein
MTGMMWECPVKAAGQVVVDYCELCALRPRELEVASSMAGWHVHGPPSWTESRVGRFNNSAFAFASSSLLQTPTLPDSNTTPGCPQLQACLVPDYTGKHILLPPCLLASPPALYVMTY